MDNTKETDHPSEEWRGPMNAKEFKKILKTGENIAVEFKRCKENPKKDTYETICSFLNRWGGDIYLGVEDDSTISGVPHNSVQNFINNIINVLGDPNNISPTVHLFPEAFEHDGKDLIHIHVPSSPEPHTYKGVYYDRIGTSDIKIKSASVIASLFMRKFDIHTEEKVYPHITDEDLRFDLFPKIRILATTKEENHPWKEMTDKEIIHSAKLYTKDSETGKWGYNLAAVLLLGKDRTIGSVCPAYRTDALFRKVNLDRYDDRLVVETNLIESYGLLMKFAQKHLLDKFHLEDDRSVSLSSKIAREMIVNTLAHREYTDGFYAKFVIEKDKMYVENANRAAGSGNITPKDVKPKSKNPIIAAFFRNLGYADELGSGTRNLFRYTRLYSGKDPQLIEDDIFRIVVPLDDDHSADAKGRESPYGDLSPLEIEIYKEIAEGRYTTAEELANLLGSSAITVKRATYRLKNLGLICREGSNKKGVWKLIL